MVAMGSGPLSRLAWQQRQARALCSSWSCALKVSDGDQRVPDGHCPSGAGRASAREAAAARADGFWLTSSRLDRAQSSLQCSPQRAPLHQTAHPRAGPRLPGSPADRSSSESSACPDHTDLALRGTQTLHPGTERLLTVPTVTLAVKQTLGNSGQEHFVSRLSKEKAVHARPCRR